MRILISMSRKKKQRNNKNSLVEAKDIWKIALLISKQFDAAFRYA